MITPLYKVGDMVMIRPDLSEDTYEKHYDNEDLADGVPEECLQYAGQITEITIVDPCEDEGWVWYKTKIRNNPIEEYDFDGEWWWMECAFIPVKDIHTLNQALLNGQISIESYNLAKEKLGDVHGI